MTGFLGILPDPFGALDTPGGRRSWLADLATSIPKAGSKNELLDQIDSALLACAPVGDTATLEALGTTYRNQVDKAGDLHDRTDKVAKKGLPEVWVGDTSVLASSAVAATGRAVTRMSEAFQGGAKALHTLADTLGAAQQQDADGRAKMRQAQQRLGHRDSFFDLGALLESEEERKATRAAISPRTASSRCTARPSPRTTRCGRRPAT